MDRVSGRENTRVEKSMVVSAYLAGILLLLSLLDGGGLGEESLLLLDLGFRSVLVEKLEGLGGGVAVKGVLELSDGRWDLQAEVEDLLLALQADILWPSRQGKRRVRSNSGREERERERDEEGGKLT